MATTPDADHVDLIAIRSESCHAPRLEAGCLEVTPSLLLLLLLLPHLRVESSVDGGLGLILPSDVLLDACKLLKSH